MRGRVDVLSCDQAITQREHVDPGPFPAAGPRGPLTDREIVADPEVLRREAQIGIRGEDPGDVLADSFALGVLVRGVVLEHHPRRMQRADRVEILGVPRVVVALDEFSDVHLRRNTLA